MRSSERQAVVPAQGPETAAADLGKAQRPAASLRDVFLQPFGREAERQPLVEIDGAEARRLHLQRDQIVLGHGVGGKAADPLQRGEANDRGRAAAEGGAPRILRGHHHVEEIALLVGPDARHRQIGLQRVGIDEVLRRLHDADVVLAKQAERPAQELRHRHEVGIENADEVGRLGQAGDVAQPVVDVAGLGMGVVGPCQIARAQALAQRLEPGAPAVIEHPDAIARVIHGQRADDGALQDRLFLIVRADEDVDERQRVLRLEPGGIAVGSG